MTARAPLRLALIRDFLSRRYLLFLFSGGTSAVVGVVLRFVFGHSMPYIPSIVLSYFFSTLTAYSLNKLLVFRSTGNRYHVELAQFFVVNLIGLGQTILLSSLLYRLLAGRGSLSDTSAETIAHAIAMSTLAVTSFMLHKSWTFSRKPTSRSRERQTIMNSPDSSIPQASRYAVIGAGPMGLASAVALLDAGHQVDIYERDDRIGGMSAAFDFDGLSIERYYHFVCKTDDPLFALLDRYGLSGALKWTDTRMGYYYKGKLYKWGSPFALLGFPHLGPISKLRYALHVMHTKGISDWSALDKEEAGAWIRRWIGDKAYNVMWKDAFRLKFFEYKDNLSASWIGTRIKRIALSRRNLFNESLGYLEGGSMTLLDRMAQDIVERGGRIFLSRGIDEVTSEAGRVTGVQIQGEFQPYDGVVSTAPIQYVPRMVPGLPAAFREQIAAIENIPVACVILKLRHAVSENFWMNISDPDIDIPGVIEYSNLNPGRDPAQKILYAPFYMPKTHPKWQQSNQELIDEVIGYLPRLNPQFRPDWVLASHCHRYDFAQTICPPGFQDMLPPMRTPLEGFFMADTAYYYPEDRSISESVQVGLRLAGTAMARA